MNMPNGNPLLASCVPGYFYSCGWFLPMKCKNDPNISNIISTLVKQGCLIQVMDISNDYQIMQEHFRRLISQIHISKLFTLILYLSEDTDPAVILNISYYLRSNYMCLISSHIMLQDVKLITIDHILSIIGNRVLTYGDVSNEDVISNVSSISNSLRFNSLSLAHSTHKNIIFVGWHLLSYIYSLHLGASISIVDAFNFEDFKRLNTIPRKYGPLYRSTKYIPPNALMKLSAIYSWAVTHYDSIIVIGGYPGDEIRKFHAYIRRFNKLVVLVDSQFSKNGVIDDCTILPKMWDFNCSIDNNLRSLNITPTGKCLILDDSWVKSNMHEFSMKKNTVLIPTIFYDVLLKFNIYEGYDYGNVVIIHYFEKFIIPPGLNDSNESRVLLSYSSSSKSFEFTPRHYLTMMHRWRHLDTSSQCYAFGVHFTGSVLRAPYNISDLKLTNTDIVVALYSLGNVSIPFNVNTLITWARGGVKFIVNLYTSVNIETPIVHYKKYTDIVYPVSDILGLFDYSQDTNNGIYSITIDKLYNLLITLGVNRKGFLLSGSVTDIESASAIMRSRILLMNLDKHMNLLHQHSAFSLGFRLKAITIYLRCNRYIGVDTTYVQRFNAASKFCDRASNISYNMDKRSIEIKNVSVATTFINKCMTLSVTNMKFIEVSGHVLNILMYELIEPGSLSMWLSQICYYYNVILNSTYPGSQLTKRNYINDWHLCGFIEVGADRLLREWHTKNDMLMGCLIADDYWSELLTLSDKEIYSLRVIASWLFNRLKNDIPK